MESGRLVPRTDCCPCPALHGGFLLTFELALCLIFPRCRESHSQNVRGRQTAYEVVDQTNERMTTKTVNTGRAERSAKLIP